MMQVQKTYTFVMIKVFNLRGWRMHGRCLCPSKDNLLLGGLQKEKERILQHFSLHSPWGVSKRFSKHLLQQSIHLKFTTHRTFKFSVRARRTSSPCLSILCLLAVYLFTHQLFIKLLQCAKHSSRSWLCNNKQKRKNSCPHGTYIPMGRKKATKNI